MIGGIVTEVQMDGDYVAVHLTDQVYGDRMWRSIALTRRSRCIGIGDSIWWHGKQTLWTPVHHTNSGGLDRDVNLGPSYAVTGPGRKEAGR